MKSTPKPEAPAKNLALDLVRVTEAAALASARWLGKGVRERGIQAAVEAMRLSFNSMDIVGKIIIGEGEHDAVPMLHSGETVGSAHGGPALDIAVDPVAGTNLLAYGRPNAISVVGAAPGGTMYNPGPSSYMRKLVVPHEARNVVDLEAPVHVNLSSIAKALGKDVDDLVVFVLDRPRHADLIQAIRKTGARIQLHADGDVTGALMAVDPRSEVDVMMGTGGTPEGVVAACAVRCFGGQIFGRLEPLSFVEKETIQDAGIDIREILTVENLVKSDDVFFSATGISGGTFLHGVQYTGHGAITHSMVVRGKTGSVRYIEAHHNWDRLMRISSVQYD